MDKKRIRSMIVGMTRDQLMDLVVELGTSSIISELTISRFNESLIKAREDCQLAELDKLTRDSNSADKKLVDYLKAIREKHGGHVKMIDLTEEERKQLISLSADANAKDDAYLKFIKKDREEGYK